MDYQISKYPFFSPPSHGSQKVAQEGEDFKPSPLKGGLYNFRDVAFVSISALGARLRPSWAVGPWIGPNGRRGDPSKQTLQLLATEGWLESGRKERLPWNTAHDCRKLISNPFANCTFFPKDGWKSPVKTGISQGWIFGSAFHWRVRYDWKSWFELDRAFVWEVTPSPIEMGLGW